MISKWLPDSSYLPDDRICFRKGGYKVKKFELQQIGTYEFDSKGNQIRITIKRKIHGQNTSRGLNIISKLNYKQKRLGERLCQR